MHWKVINFPSKAKLSIRNIICQSYSADVKSLTHEICELQCYWVQSNIVTCKKKKKHNQSRGTETSAMQQNEKQTLTMNCRWYFNFNYFLNSAIIFICRISHYFLLKGVGGAGDGGKFSLILWETGVQINIDQDILKWILVYPKSCTFIQTGKIVVLGWQL